MLRQLLVEHGLYPVAVVRRFEVGVEGAGAGSSVLGDGFGLDHVFPVYPQSQRHRNLPAADGGFDLLLVGGVDVAVERHALTQSGNVPCDYARAFADVAAEAGEAFRCDEGEPVAVVQLKPFLRGPELHGHGLLRRPAEPYDRARLLPDRLGGVHRRPPAPASVEIEFGVAAVEGLGAVGRESALHAAEGGPRIESGVSGREFVEGDVVVAHDCLHIGEVLQPSFYLEGVHPGFRQVLQPVAEIVVLQREHGLVAQQHAAVAVDEVVEGAAGLYAFSAVGGR